MTRKRKLKHRNKNLPSLRFSILFLGFLLILLSFALRIHNQTKLSFTKPIPVEKIKVSQSKPVSISIPNQKINLPLYGTVIHDGVWEINPNGASYLATAGKPGEKTNIIIYAHNTADRFKNIQNLQKGDTITIRSTNNKNYNYKVEKIEIVNPNEIGLLLPTKTEKLTIYTCTGFLDSKRFVVIATPTVN